MSSWGGGTGRVQHFHCFWGQTVCDSEKWFSTVFAWLQMHRLHHLCHVLGRMIIGEFWRWSGFVVSPFFFFFLHGGLLGKRRLRRTQACGNSRHLFPLKIMFGFGRIAQKWGEVAQVRKGRLRNCHSVRLSQFHVGVSLGLMFFLCVCVSVCLSSFSIPLPFPFLFPPVPS